MAILIQAISEKKAEQTDGPSTLSRYRIADATVWCRRQTYGISLGVYRRESLFGLWRRRDAIRDVKAGTCT
jgi:hypothetical protein